MALEGTVRVPVFGPVKKKTALIAGIGAPALVLAIYWYRARKASRAGAPAATAAAGGQVTDPAGNTCAALNPATGYCPGTQADLNAQSLGAVNASGAGEGLSGYYYGAGGVPGGNPGPGNFADNAEWVQYVIAYESNNGLNPNVAAVTVSLGLYVAGSPVTQSQQADVETAIAIAGQPPIPGATGMPPGINLQTTGTGTGTTPGTCASGYTLSATKTGASGEIPATGGAGWCEPTSTGGGSVLINIHDGTGHWQAALFPNAASVTTFLNSLGAHLDHTGVLFGPNVGQVWPTEPSPAAIQSALAAVGGTLAGPPGQSGAGIVRFQGGVPSGPVTW